MRRLPPLTAVRAFEAAARHLSLRRAAEELSVTPSAVSHQVRALEEWLGCELFRRRARGVALTAAGAALLGPLREGLDRIEAGCQRVLASHRHGLLTVRSAPTFATGWLVPRLTEFQHDHPEVEVRLTTAVAFSDFAHGDADLAIAYGAGDWPGVRCHRLMAEELVPVCSPALIAPAGPLAALDDIGRVTLLHVLPRIGQWRHWLEVAGVRDVDAERGPKFQTTPLALEAAVAGAGVAIANRRFCARHLEAGELVVPFEVDLPSSAGYYLIYPSERAGHPPLAAFRDWVLAKIERERERGAPWIGGSPEPITGAGA